ncbi:MAG: hypothetical protein ACPH56_05595 [Spongiibacter marinus]|uniref:hypothetical protein n=1 Tax=Spongiibacter TaxID=630749 RepID=UPI000C0A1631|nr:hypothetical protein [Spongiibacter sp.]MAK45430.1 hypothetical protein [Spongiibacter sp.]
MTVENKVDLKEERKKIRAQIDSETVRSVMLVNGGGSVALIALLPSIVGTPLVFGVLLALSAWLLGLTLVVIHNILRRKCSEAYSVSGDKSPKAEARLCIRPNEPWVCWWSWKLLYTSIAAFFIGGVIMVGFGFIHVDELSKGQNSIVQGEYAASQP